MIECKKVSFSYPPNETDIGTGKDTEHKEILTCLLTTGILYCSAEHRAAVKPH